MSLEEAEIALKENTYPVGAVIVDENYNLIARGRNRVHPQQDATAHAEIDAMRNSSQEILKAKIEREKLLYLLLWNLVLCAQVVFYLQTLKRWFGY